MIITKPRIKYLDNIIGFLAAFCTTVAFVPQAIKVYKTKKTDDISFGMFLLICVGVNVMYVYCYRFSIYIFVMKIRMEKKKLIFD